MLKANKDDKDSELPNVVQNQQNKRKGKVLEVYQQNTQKIKKECKTLAVSCFVSFARTNPLKQIGNVKEKAKKAVLQRGNSFTFVRKLNFVHKLQFI